MLKIIIFLPIFVALIGKFFIKNTPVFISNFQMNHPAIYIIIALFIIMVYIISLSSLFKIEEKSNKNLYIISIPIVFYLLSHLLNIKSPSFIINFANSHNIIFSILVGIITAIYLFFILLGALSVIENKSYSNSIIIFSLIPVAAIILLYIFNIGIPTFIIDFYHNHKIWFYIVLSITALIYISVLFNLLSLYSYGKPVFAFIIIFAVLTFLFRDNILFFMPYEKNNITYLEKHDKKVENNTNITVKESSNNKSSAISDKNIIVKVFTAIKDGLINGATYLKNGISKIFTAMKDGLVNGATYLKNGIRKIFTAMKDGLINGATYLKNSIGKIFTVVIDLFIKAIIIGIIAVIISIILFMIKLKFFPFIGPMNCEFHGFNSKGVNIKVTSYVVNNLPFTLKIEYIHIKLYKDNKNIGYGCKNCFYTIKSKESSDIEFDVNIYFNDAFSNIIPYLLDDFHYTA
ncbi:hypothetical protein R4K92_04555, partial [Brachyspira intermedia]|uniref:hypothetical protein n=1 Tax=Brachyspira intermedia TaxID=84377 RepID=UPI0030062EEA